MPWQPLPRIAFAVATYPFTATSPADLPLELGDELYIIEQGGTDAQWFRGYLVAPPSLLAGLTSVKGQTLEARVFSGIFPRSCVEVREVLGETDSDANSEVEDVDGIANGTPVSGDFDTGASALSSPKSTQSRQKNGSQANGKAGNSGKGRKSKSLTNGLTNGASPSLSLVAKRDRLTPKPPAPVPMLKIGDETPTSASEPLVDEIASCLREWHSTNLHELLLSRKYPLLDKLSTLVQTLDLSRRQFLHNVLTSHELKILRENTVWDLVRGNKIFGGEVIVRDPAERGRVLTGDDSAVDISVLQSMMSLLDERPLPAAHENMPLHHLLIEVKAFVGVSTESTTLVFFLASKSSGSAAIVLSESYVVEVPPSGALTSLAKTGDMRTLFSDLAAGDIGDLPSADSELYLIVKVRSTQQVLANQPVSRGGLASRDSTAATRNGDHAPTANGANKAGRRSLMWGQKPQRSAFSRNAPISSRLNSLSEQDAREQSRDGVASRGTVTNELKSGSVSQIVTRTVGIGALKLNSIMKQDEEIEQVVTVWSPATGFGQGQEKQDQGSEWDDVIRDLMDSKSGNYEKSRKAERLQLHLKAFDTLDADALIKATPTLLSGVTKTKKMGFSGAPTKPRSDIYVTVDEAFLPRQGLLSRSGGSATPIPSNLAGTNLQITLELRRADGVRIDSCIFSSSNAEAESSWESTVTERGEAWSQTLLLSVPPNDVPKCHLVMLLADVPNPPFAMCHLPLWDHQAFMRDGHHSLLLYRYDETTSSPKGNGQTRGGYLSLPWNARGKDDVSKDEALTGPIAALKVQTYLCSTKFSQDKVLLGLFRWKEQTQDELRDLLKRLVFVPEIEIVKLLNDVFDAIFGILVEHSGNDEYEDLIFSALVTVLGIVHDRRFNLGPLVDQYAETKFNYPFATSCLIRSFTRLLAKPSDPETSRKLRATFKVVRHILKFITHARGQQKEKEAGIGITSSSPGFSRNLQTIFMALDGLMRNTSPILVGSQTLAVQHFHTWLPELTGLLSPEEILHIAIDFMDSCADVKGKLILYKLVLIINYSKLDLFSQPEQKSALSANTVRWIAPHWGKTEKVTEQWRDQVRLCCSILATQIDGIGSEAPDYIPKILESYIALQAVPKTPKTRLSLLFPMAYPFPSKPISGKAEFDEALVELSATLSAVSTLPTGMQLELADEEMSTLLENTVTVHLSILQGEAFPADWLSVHIYHHKSTMKTLEYISGILLESFLPQPDDAETYNTEVWKGFFTTLLKLVGSDALALETFPEQKRRAVWKIAGDVRELGAELLRKTWEAIGWETSQDDRRRYGLTKMGGYQVQYVPVLVGPIMELCLSVHEGLRGVAVEVLQSMIVSEWTLSEDLSIIQTEMIDCLDSLFKSKPLTESILQKLFVKELLAHFEPLSKIPDEPLYAALTQLIATMEEFLDLLVAVHSPDVTGEASHMIHRLRLMEFLRDMQKEEIFIRYVHQLAELQGNARNHTEAGLALRLHADLYDWDPTRMLPSLADPVFPAQSHFERKERMYFDMIKHFEDAEAWSSALASYEELRTQYEENIYDFLKLARTQRAIATIYERIAKSDKLIPKFFRVKYSGLGFPASLRDKEFIFEGSLGEKTSVFTDRMQEQHPSAHIVTSGDVDDVEGQFLQISALSPHRDLEHHVFQRARVPYIIRDYLLSAHPQVFSVTSKRNTSGPITEHSAEKIVYTTAEPFPTILRRSEIVAVDRIKLNAFQTALERVVRKTQEMSAVEKRVADGEEEMASLLIEALKISVDPDSQSSVAQYRDLLPTNDDSGEVQEGVHEEVQLQPHENALKIALIDHAIMIKRCFTTFSKNDMLAAGESLEELIQDFEQTFAVELASLASPQPVLRELTPVPAWSISSPVPEKRQSLALPNSNTDGTISTTDTSILDSPRQTRQEKSRMSFLKKTPQPQHQTQSQAEPISTPTAVTNGHGNERGPTSDSLSTRSRSNENRRSFFSANGFHRGTGTSLSEKDDEVNWITQSDLTASDVSLKNSTSQKQDGATNVGSKSGSVRKRLSKLKLGKKGSKNSVVVASVTEED